MNPMERKNERKKEMKINEWTKWKDNGKNERKKEKYEEK